MESGSSRLIPVIAAWNEGCCNVISLIAFLSRFALNPRCLELAIPIFLRRPFKTGCCLCCFILSYAICVPNRAKYQHPKINGLHLDYAYPDAANELNRWLPLVKWFLAIPHYIMLFFLDIAAVVVVIIA